MSIGGGRRTAAEAGVAAKVGLDERLAARGT
jgi:hypothetical protein